MNLVVLTKQFGNYTGATVSTVQLLKKINSNFDRVTVLTLKSDGTVINNVNIKVCNNYLSLIRALKMQKNVIGYSDDHLGFLFSLANIKYIHTYHGNWPDARKLNFEMFAKSFYFMPLYKLTIKKAYKVISVSKYMMNTFIIPINLNVSVIYNGIKQDHKKRNKNIQSNNRFLMVGNVDKRKYGKALKIFDILQSQNFNGTIDIFGALLDSTLVSKLNKYAFINVKGMADIINYTNYKGLICTSASENLPVSIVEAIINNTPVISSNVGGISEIIDNDCGVLLDIDDYESFAREILYYRKKEIPIEYIKKIKTMFNWSNSSELYMQAFRRIE